MPEQKTTYTALSSLRSITIHLLLSHGPVRKFSEISICWLYKLLCTPQSLCSNYRPKWYPFISYYYKLTADIIREWIQQDYYYASTLWDNHSSIQKTKSELYYSEKCCPCTYCPAGSTAARQLERVHISRFFFLGLRRGGWCMRRMVSKNPRFHHMKTTHLDVYWLDGLYIHPVRSFYFLFVASHQSFSEPNYLIRRISTFPRTL
jgi:hypothetical protein